MESTVNTMQTADNTFLYDRMSESQIKDRAKELVDRVAWLRKGYSLKDYVPQEFTAKRPEWCNNP